MLNASEREFLQAVEAGESQAAYARRQHYSRDWAKWMSKKVRAKLGVTTLGEAIAMSEGGDGSAAKLDKLTSLIEATNDAVAALAKAVTPQQQQQAQQQVVEREMDEKEMAKKLGLSLDDVAKVREEKDYQVWKKNEERRQKELAEEQGEVEPQRDGLGGILNLARGGKAES